MDDHKLLEQLELIRGLMQTLIDKTHETNRLLKEGISTQWGHNMATLAMDPDRFKKNEGKERHF